MKQVFLIIGILFCYCGNAQSFLKTNYEDSLMQQMFEHATYVVRQDYYLLDTTGGKNEKFGRNKMPYYGRVYTVGLLAEGKLYTTGNVLTPWIGDANYSKSLSARKLVPMLGEVSISLLNAKNFKEIKLNRDSIETHNSYVAIRLPDSIKGVTFNENSKKHTENTYWFYFVSKEKGTDGDTANYVIDGSRGRVIDSAGRVTINSIFINKPIISGFGFRAVPSMGSLHFQLAGMCEEINNKIYFRSMITPEAKKPELNLTPLYIN